MNRIEKTLPELLAAPDAARRPSGRDLPPPTACPRASLPPEWPVPGRCAQSVTLTPALTTIALIPPDLRTATATDKPNALVPSPALTHWEDSVHERPPHGTAPSPTATSRLTRSAGGVWRGCHQRTLVFTLTPGHRWLQISSPLPDASCT